MTIQPHAADGATFPDFFSGVGTPLAILAPDGRVTRVNDAWATVLGGARPVIGDPFLTLLHPSDRAPIQARLAALTPGAPATFEARVNVGKEGEPPRPLRFHATRAGDGRTHLVGIETPIGQADERLRLELFDAVLESAPVALFAVDGKGLFTAWEGEGVRLMGTEPGDLVGKSCLDEWKDTEAFPSILRALGGEEFNAQVSFPGSVHSDVWFLPVRDKEKNPAGVIGFGLDVTRRRQAETELRDKLAIIERQNATLKMLSRVLDSAPIILWCIDEEGTYTMSEGKGLELLGFRPAEMVGLNALEMFKDHGEIAEALVKALSGEESRVLTTPAPGVHFENWYMPLRGGDGAVYGVMGLAIDASERVASELVLREKVALIERQSATIRALATPIIQVWDEVLCLPVIGTVDSARTAEMMQGLLEAIVREQARYAIVDLTGVEVVDTSTADHLIQLFRAAKVLGVDGVLCGIRPAVAQTVVALGLDLGSVKTMRSLRDALKWCIRMRGDSRTNNAALGLASALSASSTSPAPRAAFPPR